MKKLLVMLTMLAAVSNAVVLELSVNGVTNGPGMAEITIAPSDTVMIDVSCTGDPDYADWSLYVVGPGSMAGVGTVYSPPGPVGAVADYYGDLTYLVFSSSPEIVALDLGTWWEEEFHCDGLGDVLITLYDANLNELDWITIHQDVPEPMTIALLGLGGLFLRRRK